MRERSTINPPPRKSVRFSPQQEASDPQRMGEGRKRRGNRQKYQLHPHTLYRWKKLLEKGVETFLRGTRPRPDPYLKRLEKENQRLKEALALQTQELMLLKKERNLV